MRSLVDRVAWITGAGTGIGRGVALALANSGVDVVLSGRRRAQLEEVAQSVRSVGRRALVAPLDVSDREGVSNVVSQGVREFGTIHILVNNAGINTTKRTATEIEPADWDHVVKVNLTGAFN